MSSTVLLAIYNFLFHEFFFLISGNESFSETLSADSSMEHAKKEDDNIKQPQESEQKIVDLITESKWIEAVQAYKIHKIRWPGL